VKPTFYLHTTMAVMTLTLNACTGLEIGIETTPTPVAPGATGTAIAAPTATPPPLATPTVAVPTPLPAGWTTLRDDQVGFEIDHPSEWVVDSSEMLTTLWSRRVEGPGNDGVPADVTKIDIVADPSLPASIEDLVEQQRRDVTQLNGQILSEEDVTLAGELPAKVLRISSMAESWSLYTVIDGRVLIVVGYGDLSQVPGVALTLRAASP
jgi:hypothetical protein